MQSEYYHLRRTAIKDLAAYCGFLLGFLGSAPLAWELLASQLDAGNFARGLWYFFGIVTAAGIFAGIAGLGVGFVFGLSWEQFHRFRRRARAKEKAALEKARSGYPDEHRRSVPVAIGSLDETAPRLRLVSTPLPFPDLTGRRVASIQCSYPGRLRLPGFYRGRFSSSRACAARGNSRGAHPSRGRRLLSAWSVTSRPRIVHRHGMGNRPRPAGHSRATRCAQLGMEGVTHLVGCRPAAGYRAAAAGEQF